MGPGPKLHYRNPVELGWAGMIKFDHDFVGRKALEPVVANVGAGAIVAAGAVVNRDLPPGAIAAGVPARIVKQRVTRPVAVAGVNGSRASADHAP